MAHDFPESKSHILYNHIKDILRLHHLSLTSPPTSLSFTHFTPAALAFFCSPLNTKHTPVSSALHLLFSVTRMLFLQISA